MKRLFFYLIFIILFCFADSYGQYRPPSGGGGGSGTVTNVSSANARATVANPTTTPVITVVSAPSADTAFKAGIADTAKKNLVPSDSAITHNWTVNQLALKAPIASPTFTGTVTVPTPFTLGLTSVTTTGTQLNYLNATTGTTGTASTNLVFSSSPTLATPTFTTSHTSPLAIGGTGTTSTLTLQSTSGSGTTGSDIIFKDDNTEWMRILNNGNVGIGTTGPNTQLEVWKATANQIAITTEHTNAAGDEIISSMLFQTPNSSYVNFGDSWRWRIGKVRISNSYNSRFSLMRTVRNGVTDSEDLTISPSGNVGIGTTSPVVNSRLAIKDGHLQIQQTTAPTYTVNINAGSGATGSLANHTDVAGQVTLNAGTSGWAAGEQIKITFNKTYTTAPVVIIYPQTSTTATSGRSPYTTSTTTDFSINFASAEVTNRIHVYWYIVIETQ